MVNYQRSALDELFVALADPTRRGMVERLCAGPATVGELGEPYALTKPAITKHVRMLERAGLLRRHRIGRVHRCVLVPSAMRRAESWLEKHRRYWEASLDRLARHVEGGHAPHLHLTEDDHR